MTISIIQRTAESQHIDINYDLACHIWQEWLDLKIDKEITKDDLTYHIVISMNGIRLRVEIFEYAIFINYEISIKTAVFDSKNLIKGVI